MTATAWNANQPLPSQAPIGTAGIRDGSGLTHSGGGSSPYYRGSSDPPSFRSDDQHAMMANLAASIGAIQLDPPGQDVMSYPSSRSASAAPSRIQSAFASRSNSPSRGPNPNDMLPNSSMGQTLQQRSQSFAGPGMDSSMRATRSISSYGDPRARSFYNPTSVTSSARDYAPSRAAVTRAHSMQVQYLQRSYSGPQWRPGPSPGQAPRDGMDGDRSPSFYEGSSRVPPGEDLVLAHVS